MTSRSRGTNLIVSKAQRNPFYPRMALIGTNKTEALAESLILCRKIEFSAKYSFVFICVISGQIFPFFKLLSFYFCLLSFVSYLIKLRVPQSNAYFSMVKIIIFIDYLY